MWDDRELGGNIYEILIESRTGELRRNNSTCLETGWPPIGDAWVLHYYLEQLIEP